MANILCQLCRMKQDFGMDGLFRQFGIYSREGQKYEPEDADSNAKSRVKRWSNGRGNK